MTRCDPDFVASAGQHHRGGAVGRSPKTMTLISSSPSFPWKSSTYHFSGLKRLHWKIPVRFLVCLLAFITALYNVIIFNAVQTDLELPIPPAPLLVSNRNGAVQHVDAGQSRKTTTTTQDSKADSVMIERDKNETNEVDATPTKSFITEMHGNDVRPMAKRDRKFFPQWRPGKKNDGGSLQIPYGGAFVHMGKTGGSTLSLQLRNGCHSYMKHPCRKIPEDEETLISKTVLSYYHVPDFAFLQQSYHDYYIITTREPYDRFVSAFVYDHLANRRARNDTSLALEFIPKQEEAYRCFPTLDKFVSYLDGNITNYNYPYSKKVVVATPCRDFARAVFDGRVKVFRHMFFSYQKIYSFIPDIQEKTIYATRQEHLMDDWYRINNILIAEQQQATAKEKEPTYAFHQPESVVYARSQAQLEAENRLPVRRELSDKGRHTLCRALQEEYRKYFWFLMKARNLNETDVQEAIHRSQTRCPSVQFATLLLSFQTS